MMGEALTFETRESAFERSHGHLECETPATCFDSFNWGWDARDPEVSALIARVTALEAKVKAGDELAKAASRRINGTEPEAMYSMKLGEALIAYNALPTPPAGKVTK